jgi:chromosome partitioning protein
VRWHRFTSSFRPACDDHYTRPSVNIVVANLKGGVGKTTAAVYLSAVAVARGYDPVLLIDADRQASSAEWLEERPIEGVSVIEAPSERTLARAMSRHDGIGIIDTPPGDERLVQSAVAAADAVVIPTRAGGVEFARVVVTLAMISPGTPRGVVISAARLGTNDLDETIAWWKAESVPVWGVIPERVGIAAGPEARLYRDGLDQYAAVLRHSLRRR